MRRKQSTILLLVFVICISISSSIYLNQIDKKPESQPISMVKQEIENNTPDVKAAKYLVQRFIDLLHFSKSI